MGNNTGKAFARGGVRDDVARVVHPPSPQLMTATLVWHCSKLPMGRGLSKHDALALDKPLSARPLASGSCTRTFSPQCFALQ